MRADDGLALTVSWLSVLARRSTRSPSLSVGPFFLLDQFIQLDLDLGFLGHLWTPGREKDRSHARRRRGQRNRNAAAPPHVRADPSQSSEYEEEIEQREREWTGTNLLDDAVGCVEGSIGLGVPCNATRSMSVRLFD